MVLAASCSAFCRVAKLLLPSAVWALRAERTRPSIRAVAASVFAWVCVILCPVWQAGTPCPGYSGCRLLWLPNILAFGHHQIISVNDLITSTIPQHGLNFTAFM